MKQASSRAQVQAQVPYMGQGTIEYLVIIAVVVVIGLVVVGLLLGMTGSSTGLSTNSTKINSKVGSGGISIGNVVTDSNGDGIFSVGNTSGETITLTKIATGGLENSYSQTVPIGSSVVLGVNSLNLKCPCVAGQTKVSCDYNVSYTSGNGFPKTVLVTVQADCVSDSTTTTPLIVPVMTVTNSNCWIDVNTNPNPICTLSDLNKMREHLNWNYELKADINAAATKTWADVNGFMPVGTSFATPFSGNFNGNNHYISSLYIYRPGTNYIGLFGYTSGSAVKIQNVGVRDVNITGNQYVGGLVGWMQSANSVSGCYSSGNVTGVGTNVGGLIGYLQNYASVSDSYSTVNVTGAGNVGGLIGGIDGILVSRCYATGRVTGGGTVGGLIGYTFVGGVSDSYATGNVTGSGDSVGGLIGTGTVGVSRCYATGSVTGSSWVGGLMGRSTNSVLSSYATGDVNGLGNYVGGLVGYANFAKVKNSFSKGTVDGNSYVGGLVGYTDSSTTKDINTNYSISRVNGLFAPINGFVGQKTNADVNIVFNAYWNPTLSTKSNCYRNDVSVDTNTNCTAGTFVDTNFYGATGVPFTQLGFDGNWVSQTSGYPKLSWQTN